MHNNIKNKEQDAFSKSIRQKLEGHKTPVAPDLWAAIEAGIRTPKAKRKIPIIWWITTGLAAAVALLLVVNIPINQHKSEMTSTTKSSMIEKSTSVESVVPENIVVTNNNNTIASVSKNTISNKTIINKTILNKKTTFTDKKNTDNTVDKTTSNESPNFKIAVSENDIIALNNTKGENEISTEGSTILAQTENKSTTETAIDTLVSTPKPTPNEKLQLKKEDWTDPLKEKNTNNWELAAMVGSAGRTNTNTNLLSAPVFDYSPRMGIVAAERATTYIFAPEDFTDKTYLAPVSAGLAIARNISSAWSIESGITYTYLLTSFKNNTVDSKLHLHYIGLPARVVFDFVKNKKWSAYAATGGMVEKGLWSVYVQNQNYGSSIITTTVSDKISGWQYSINASIGGAYSIYKNTAIYFEPKLSYYFDTNQPISIRSANKYVIGFEGGVRYKF